MNVVFVALLVMISFVVCTESADAPVKPVRRQVRIRPTTRNRERHEAVPGTMVDSDVDLAPGAASSVLRHAAAPGNRLDDEQAAAAAAARRRRLPAADVLSRRRSRLPVTRRGVGTKAAPVTTVAVDDPDKKYKIVCYYTNWSQYRPTIGKYVPEDIDPFLCTHVIFAFGWLKKGKLASFEGNDETKDGKVGLYERIAKLKEANPELKTLLAIGGWSFGTQKFKDMSKTRYARQIFIFSALAYLREHKFDGLDIDWEYPKGKDDKKNYVSLLKEVRKSLETASRPRVSMSIVSRPLLKRDIRSLPTRDTLLDTCVIRGSLDFCWWPLC
ncbi:unnamed protein product [Notodromas monacha]|uniref:GH18 domain-containing protein n=1 Tax=Notodromas monacha TaxID=399045 RepID=A0A7R9BSI5_9CRUS|nr:unnamed protein product [Notodromas monacha]CAG0919892.1 unnamed protein product [Notodromas monacha]